MSIIVLDAEKRTTLGKGASRRLRRLENKVPAVLYGGDKKPQSLHLYHHKVIKALENESVYSSIFDLNIEGKVEHVILKALQRHPYKPIILHMDLQRVAGKDVLVKNVPLHFTNQEIARGVKAGGRISHALTQIEVRCQAKNLPAFIEVDMTNVNLNDVIHLSDIKLPKGVQLTININDSQHNLPVVSIHAPKGGLVDEEADVVATKETGETE